VKLTASGDLAAAQDALARGEWEAARDAFAAAGETGEALEGLSWAAWWLGDEPLTFSARERAHRAHRAAGDSCSAARMAIWLASDHLDFRGDDAAASGWLDRASRLLSGLGQCAEQGWHALVKTDLIRRTGGDPAAVVVLAREAQRVGRALHVADVETVGLAIEGAALIQRGEMESGMRRLAEASALASGEDFDLALAPGWAMCCAVSACEGVGDFPRAEQWSLAMRAFVDRWGGRNMMGMCRSAYGHVLTAGGRWEEAEAELTAAVDDLTASRPALAGAGLLRLAELRARQGRTAEARELYERIRAAPAAIAGLGALALADGDAAAARDAGERVLRRVPANALLERLPALELLARAQIALGRLDEAQGPHDELQRIAAQVATPYLLGRAHAVGAELAAARGDHDAARRKSEDAVDRFDESAAPYEGALARLELARALTALGRPEAGEPHAAAARDALAALGATADLAAATPASGSGELTARELEILRLVAHGLSDAEIAERLVLSPHTVHRHVANVRTKLRLPSRSAAVAYAARAGLL
jgi:ATP/maltotriose-dependent transcriptional regulator MalT